MTADIEEASRLGVRLELLQALAKCVDATLALLIVAAVNHRRIGREQVIRLRLRVLANQTALSAAHDGLTNPVSGASTSAELVQLPIACGGQAGGIDLNEVSGTAQVARNQMGAP
jgi:hypothetical protein